ncbi:MAG: glycosyltransferase family 9 protein [Sulfuricurvum sp.]|nr:glycosyltransferase family 9 protein [Sulfuricurvum sp.]
MNRVLYFLFPNHTTHERIPQQEIERILVVRINYRIGNILFTTPLLRALEQRFPNAEMDILIGARYPSPLLKGFKTVQNVFDFPRKLLKNPFYLIRYIRQLRAKNYDLIINLNSGSASDRAATFLAKGKYKLGFHVTKEWSPLTHTVDIPAGEIHEAIKPLYLMEAFGNHPNEFPQKMDIALNDDERLSARNELQNRLMEQGGRWDNRTKIVGIFRDARFEKKIENGWWQGWYTTMKALNPDALFIDILSPDVTEKLDTDLYVILESNLRRLGALLSQMDMFVCGDTGPMHLASASGVPTIALFKVTTPALYGTLGANDRSLIIGDKTPEMIASSVSEHLAALPNPRI